ncbi:hypothetical protein ACE7GA_11855 [Roseomonas sp. CCTCC AB2023176]|uniref:hypothetical protein n=1 Tax=Roseomonas sp. CCTCC AB2023176 TaxID=3342640 RepID=UPI0035DD92D4
MGRGRAEDKWAEDKWAEDKWANPRGWLAAAQAGSRPDYVAFLRWAEARARGRIGRGVEAEAGAREALRLIHALRHTWEPSRCPVAWTDSVIGFAMRGAAEAAQAAKPPIRSGRLAAWLSPWRRRAA